MTNVMSDVYVALLRGVNVGGKNSLPMKDLAEMFGKARCENVRTYIQSGNVIFASGESAKVAAAIEQQIVHRFGFRSPVILRSLKEMRAVVAGNPFLMAGAALERLHVSFLAERPTAGRIASLDPHRSPPDEFIVKGREIYLHTPNGMGKTKLTSTYFDSELATVGTVRNWRTTTKLLEMMESRP